MPLEKMERADYPTQKPVELIQRIVDSSCPPWGLVFDSFCGSGTTLAVGEGLRVGHDIPTSSHNNILGLSDGTCASKPEIVSLLTAHPSTVK
jgi:DNA methylase